MRGGGNRRGPQIDESRSSSNRNTYTEEFMNVIQGHRFYFIHLAEGAFLNELMWSMFCKPQSGKFRQYGDRTF